MQGSLDQPPIDFTPSYHAGSSGFRQPTNALTSVDGSLGGGWELEAADLHPAQA